MSDSSPDQPVTPDGAIQLRRWLGLSVLLLAVPLVAALGEALADPLRDPLLPGPSATWAAALAALAAGTCAGLTWRADGRGARRGAALGGALALAVVAGGLAMGIGAPTAAAVPGCASSIGTQAGVIDASAEVDGRLRDTISAAPDGGAGLAAVVARLAALPREDHGVELVGGVAARHCSVLVDGSDALAAFPPLAELVGEPDGALTELPIWRGELSWWVAADGRLALARVSVGGLPADAWHSVGLRGRLDARLRPG